MKRKIIVSILLVISLFYKINISALSYGGCEYSEVSKLRSFVSNINLSYDYYMTDGGPYFNITISNLTPDIYFVDSFSGSAYYYSNSYDGEIVIKNIKNTSGNYKFYSAKEECYGIKLGNKYYKLPAYNNYYDDDLCKQNPNFSLCQKWVKVNLSREEFKEAIEKYYAKEETQGKEDSVVAYEKTILDQFVNFYTKYYQVLLISIISICVFIMLVERKKNKFDL